MKTWQKIVSTILVAAVLIAAVFFLKAAQTECCLCSSFRYHAPCLIDLETGELVELELYFPHFTKVAELAEEQPDVGAFSPVYLGNVSGYRDTAARKAKIEIPPEITFFPALCKDCRQQLGAGYCGRYVLADLYDRENKTLIPIAAGTAMNIRCYEITMSENQEDNDILVIVRGTLEQ